MNTTPFIESSSIPASSHLPLVPLVTNGRHQPFPCSPSLTPTLRADHQAPTANVTHVSHISSFTTGAHHEGLSGLFSILLCFLLDTLWGPYHLQLTNTVAKPHSHSHPLCCLHSLPPCQPIDAATPIPHSSCTLPALPHSHLISTAHFPHVPVPD